MERKSRRDKIPGKKLHIYKCHLGLSTVVDHEHCPPIGDSHYYQGFEFYPIGEMGIEPSKDRLEKYFRQYLTPYFESEDIFEDELSEDFVADPLLSKKCSDCRSTSDCDEAVKSSFSRKLVLGIHVEKQAFCPKEKYLLSSESECKFCRKLFDGKPRLSKKKIRIHDLRFMGHPVEVNIDYLYARCSRKVDGMKDLPGIHEGSNSNPIRFSWLSPYAFTKNGDFDYSKGSTVEPPLDELLQLLQVGLVSEGGTVPLTQLLQIPETPTDLN